MTDDDPRARAIALARKLLNQAEHPNTAWDEQQTFAAKAAEIMLRHDLTEAIVRASTPQATAADPVDVWRFTVSGSGGHGRHRAWGLGLVAEAYGCMACYSDNTAGNQPRIINIVGPASDLDALRVLLPTVAALAETAAASATRRHRQNLTEGGWHTPADLTRDTNRYRRSFLHGFGSGVAYRISRRREAVVAELASTGSGAELVLVDRAARIAADFERRYPKVRKARRVRGRSDLGLRDGYSAGQAANLGDANTLATTDTRQITA